jgi:hypothetical protein
MGEPGSKEKNKPTPTPTVTDILESGHALGQIAAAARGLEIALEQQSAREKELREENNYLRDSGRQLAAELTDLMMKVRVAEEASALNAMKLDESLRERTLLREEFQQREHAVRLNEEKQRTIFAAESIARENQIREEVHQVAKFSATEARIERDKLIAKITELGETHEAFRTLAIAENLRLRDEAKVRTETIAAITTESDRARATLAEFQASTQTRIAGLEATVTELNDALRSSQLDNTELTGRLDRERKAARLSIQELKTIREDSESRNQNLQAEAQSALRQARIELDTRLKQAQYEAQTDLELARRENRERIEELESTVGNLSDELEIERKRTHEAEKVRQTAEQNLDSHARNSLARIRRLETECAELSDELKLTLENSERRMEEIRTEARIEKTKLAKESAEILAETKAREDDARERANAATLVSEDYRREAEAAKREIIRLRSPLDSGVDQLRDTCEQLRKERETLMRARAEERADFQTEISKLRAEIELSVKRQRELQHRRVTAEVEELRWENDAAAESPKKESSLSEVLRKKELEIKRARTRLAKEKPIDN